MSDKIFLVFSAMHLKKLPVSIAGGEGAFDNTIKALRALDLSSIYGKKILIKPNIGRSAKPEQGYNTHPQALAAVIETMQKNGASEIAVGESPLVGIDTFEAFKKAGITQVVNTYNVNLIDLDSAKPRLVNIPHSRVVENTKICSRIFEFDFLISLPVAKTHMHTGVTLGIKNLKGCLYRHEKVRYHQLEYLHHDYPEKTLDSAISDLATVLMPDMVVVDGYIGMEGLGPSGGDAIKSDFAVASFSALGADLFACKLMGIDAQEVPHLRLVAERNKLSIKEEDYLVIPDNYIRFKKEYKRPPKSISVEYDNVVVYDKGSCSSCLSTLMLFLRRFKDDMSQYLLDDNKFHIAIGKGVDKHTKKGTVYIGNCTRHMKDNGIYVKGCPPVPTRIYEAIVGREPEENEPEVE
jgi:uncharacterized protein (DUF362 family)